VSDLLLDQAAIVTDQLVQHNGLYWASICDTHAFGMPDRGGVLASNTSTFAQWFCVARHLGRSLCGSDRGGASLCACLLGQIVVCLSVLCAPYAFVVEASGIGARGGVRTPYYIYVLM